MKSIIIAIVTAIVVFAIFYLLASFVEISFDIAKWTNEARITVGCWGGLIALVLGAFVWADNEGKQN